MGDAAPTHRSQGPHWQRRDLGEGAFLAYAPGFVADADRWMAGLLAELSLEQETIVLFGRPRPVPRLVGYYGDPGRTYRYSGRTHHPATWTPLLNELRCELLAHTGAPYDSVLVNLYRDGSDSMGWHADDEPELGPRPDDIRIASISLGAPRRFQLEHRRDRRRLDYRLGNGDLLVMGGTTQTHWRHRIPRSARQVGPRLNLSFRCVGPAAHRGGSTISRASEP